MNKMALTPKGLRLMLIGLLVMVAGYMLMMGGGLDDPAVFNYKMFNFRRLVAAPVVILSGMAIIFVAILGKRKNKEEDNDGDK